MIAESGFLAAIVEQPEEDVHRLVWADWLEEQGQIERAAFVRAQVAAAQREEFDRTGDRLLDEADDLLARFDSHWSAEVSKLVLDYRWHRGCIEHVTITSDALLRHGDAIFAIAPIRSLRLIVDEADVTALGESAQLRRIERLDVGLSDPAGITGRFHRDRVWQRLLESPNWQRLTDLNLEGQGIEGPLMRTLAETGLFGRLRRLELGYNRSFGSSAARWLLTAGAPHLEELGLRGTNLFPANLETLLGAQTLPSLRRLDVNLGLLLRPLSRLPDLVSLLNNRPLTQWSLDQVALKETELLTLLESPAARHLTRLQLSNCALSGTEARVLAGCSQLDQLRSLDLSSNRLRDRGALILAGSPYLGSLSRLYLGGNDIGGPGIRALLQSPTLAGLRELDLSSNYLGTAGCQALSDSAQPRRLERLGLRNGNIDVEGVQALLNGPALTRLRQLDLSDNRLGDAGLRLLQGPTLSRLEQLFVDNNGINSLGVQALLTNGLPRLREVSVRQANLTQADSDQLRARFLATL